MTSGTKRVEVSGGDRGDATPAAGRRSGRTGLGAEAYVSLRDAIISGELLPDEPLSEVALAQRLRISRTPVREALMRLAGDGLVRIAPGRGARVAGISLTDIKDLFELREVLEGLAARLAAERTSADPGPVDSLIGEFARYRTTKGKPDFEAYYRLTSRLDNVLVERAGNRRLEEVLRDVWAHSSRLRQYASHDVPRLEASAREHVAILEAVRAGDGELAERAVRRHMANSRQAVLAKVLGTTTERPRQGE